MKFLLSCCYAMTMPKSPIIELNRQPVRRHLSWSYQQFMVFFLIHSHTCFGIGRCSSHSEVRRHHQPLREQTHQGLSLFISNLCYETHFYIESTFRESISIGASLKNFQLHNNSKSIAVSGKEKLQWRSDGFDASRDWFWWSIIFFYEWRLGICCAFFSPRREREWWTFYTIFYPLTWGASARAQARWEVEVQRSNLLIVGMKWKGELELKVFFFIIIIGEHAMWTINHLWAIC